MVALADRGDTGVLVCVALAVVAVAYQAGDEPVRGNKEIKLPPASHCGQRQRARPTGSASEAMCSASAAAAAAAADDDDDDGGE